MPDRIKVTAEEEAMLYKFRALDEHGKSAVLCLINHEYSYMPLIWVRERRKAEGAET